jgi:hypothetical protein
LYEVFFLFFLFFFYAIRCFSWCHHHFSILKIFLSISSARFSSVFSYDVFVLVFSWQKNFSKDFCANVYESTTIRKSWVHEMLIFIIYVNISHRTKIIIICELLISDLMLFVLMNFDFFVFALTCCFVLTYDFVLTCDFVLICCFVLIFAIVFSLSFFWDETTIFFTKKSILSTKSSYLYEDSKFTFANTSIVSSIISKIIYNLNSLFFWSR